MSPSVPSRALQMPQVLNNCLTYSYSAKDKGMFFNVSKTDQRESFFHMIKFKQTCHGRFNFFCQVEHTAKCEFTFFHTAITNQ